MILNDIRMSDTQLDPETDHTPYCPGRDKGFIIGRSKQLQIGSPARDSARGTRGSQWKGQWKEKGFIIGRSKQLQIGSPARDSACGTLGSQWKEKGYRAHAEGCDGYAGALEGARARAHARARACAGGPQSRKLLLLQDLQKPLAAWSADP